MASNPPPHQRQKSQSEFPLPVVTKALDPFLLSRNDVITVRRQLSHVLAQVAESYTSPTTVTSVKQSSTIPQKSLSSIRIEQHLTGVRKQYVKSLREHQQALLEYQAANAELTALLGPKTVEEDEKPLRQINTNDDWLTSYNQVLDLRRRYETLTILEKYVTRLREEERQSQESWNKMIAGNSKLGHLPGSMHQYPQLHNGGDDSEVSELLIPLEKAVVQAAEDFEVEKQKLEDIKAQQRQHREHGSTNGQAASNRLRALEITKAELERWLEEQLNSASEINIGTEPKDRRESGTESLRNTEPVDLDDKMKEMRECYDDYIQTRKELLETLSMANVNTNKNIPANTSHQSIPSTLQITDDVKEQPEETPLPKPTLLPHLQTLTTIQHRSKNIHNLQSALTATIATANKQNDDMLQRLRSESHLLEAFTANGDLIKEWIKAAEIKKQTMTKDVTRDVRIANKRLTKAEEKMREIEGLVAEEGVWGQLHSDGMM